MISLPQPSELEGSPFHSATICSVRVDFSTPDALLAQLTSAASTRIALGVHFVNAYTLSLADRDDGYAALLMDSDMNLPDGRPLEWAGRCAGVLRARQLCGPDFMSYAFERGASLKHFLYGGSPATLAALEARLRLRFPDADIAGTESPPFRPLSEAEERRTARRIRASGANVVWIGLGTPKQDFFVERMKVEIGLPVLAVGAAFDFHAGTKKRPPQWVSRVGLEWAYRLASEPRRLWRRYLVGNIRFIIGLIRGGVKVVR